MATTKKYVSLEKLSLYDTKIKAKIATDDADTLASAKSYADGLATNYDAAGSAATALTNAKSYTDTEVATANAAAAAAQTQADKGVADAATAKAAADAAQADVDALETYVGTIPAEYTETNVIAYINKKAQETLETASGGSSESAASVLAALNTYKAENDPKVAANTTAAANAQTAADNAQADVDAVSAKVTTLIGSDASKSVRTIANEELAAQLIPESAAESLDTLQEIAAWIQSHPDDASAMNQAIIALETLVGEIPEGATATDIVGYIQEVVAAEKTRAEGIEGGLDTRLTAVEGKFSGTGEGSVSKMIADAKDEAVATAAADATTKANTAETNAKAYADGLDTAMDTRVDALEATTHTHSNKALLDTYTQTEENLADAVAKKHSHANATVLDGITAEKVAEWDNVSAKADQTALQAEIDRATAAEQANAEAIAAFVEVSEEEINALFA